MIAVPLFQMMNKVGAVDSYAGLILVHSAWGIPWTLFFMRNYFMALPIEVEEAAKVDGASDWRIFFQIIMPMALPALASAAVLQFMWVWSDFFLALILHLLACKASCHATRAAASWGLSCGLGHFVGGQHYRDGGSNYRLCRHAEILHQRHGRLGVEVARAKQVYGG